MHSIMYRSCLGFNNPKIVNFDLKENTVHNASSSNIYPLSLLFALACRQLEINFIWSCSKIIGYGPKDMCYFNPYLISSWLLYTLMTDLLGRYPIAICLISYALITFV